MHYLDNKVFDIIDARCNREVQYCVCWLVEIVKIFIPLSVAHRLLKPQRFLEQSPSVRQLSFLECTFTASFMMDDICYILALFY